MLDYIVVGAGSSGCALVGSLIAAGKSVSLVEAGGGDFSPFIKIPAGQPKAIINNSFQYKANADLSRNGDSEVWSTGRVLGGGSSINGTMFVRGSRSDFDCWATQGNEGWAFSDLLPIFKEMESADQMNKFRGNTGPLFVRTVSRPHKLTKAFVSSAAQAGIPFNKDYNGQYQHGVAFAQLSQEKGFRCSSASAFLKPHLKSPKLTRHLNSTVERLLIKDGQVTGVVVRKGKKTHTLVAKRVVLCAGALNTPKILMLSGVGDVNKLREVGVEPIVESAQVGKNLQEHPLVRLTYETSIPSNNLSEGIFQKIGIAYEYVRNKQGPISNIFEAVAFIKTKSDLKNPDVQIHFITVGLRKPKEVSDSMLLKFPSITVYVNVSHPKCKGEVYLRSKDPIADPVIDFRLLDSEEDVDTLVRAIEIVRKIVQGNCIKPYIKQEVSPGVNVNNPEKLRSYVRNNTEISYHPVGTCRMGPDSDSVVSSDLKVRGLDNLWIADASIMPNLISGNTNATCILIGLKAAEILISTE